MFIFTLIVIGLLLLAFKSTRLAGVAGLTLLSLIYVWLFLALLVIGSVVFYFIHYKKWSIENAIRKLHDRRAR